MKMGADLRQRIDSVRWFHSIELEPGLVTPGLDDTRERLDILRLPEDLTGKSVLDVGAWDGFFSFACEARGAGRVLATDSFAWEGSNWSDKTGFELAREALESRVEDLHVDALDISPETVGGRFDVVLCLGVLYHLRDPWRLLERLASVTAELLVLETHVDMTWTRRPAMAVYPSHELDLDPTNFCGPNVPAVIGMLRAVGFEDVSVVTPNGVGYRAVRTLRRGVPWVGQLVRHRARPPFHPFQGRAVFHARR